MVGLSRTLPVENLLSRFRAAPSESDPSLARTVTSAAPSPPMAAHELVLSQAVALQETRSQTDRRARADAGDLQARLDLIPLDVVEDHLSRSFRAAQPDCSILECLRGEGESLKSHQAASVVLEELADSTEQAAFTSALVYRYIQAKSLWKGHPDPKVISAEAFLDTLDNSDYVKANIFIGSSADHSKKKSLQVIAREWGSDWFEKIPNELCDPMWARAEECSKRLLAQMAKNARKYSLDEAIDHWSRSMKRRINERARVELGIRLPRSRHVILDDVRSLNEKEGGNRESRDGDGHDAPDSPRHDQLRVELVAPASLHPQALKKPDFSAAGPPRVPRKRKRNTAELSVETVSGEDTEENDGWRVLENGKEMVKRVGKSLLHKPIDLTSSGSQVSHISGLSQREDPADESVSRVGRTHSYPTCDGPAVALLLHKFIGAFREMPALDNDPEADHRCCDSCRPVALRAFKILENVLLPCAGDLENIGTHHYGGEDVDASQLHDISPHKRARIKRRAIQSVQDSSDDDEVPAGTTAG